MTRAAEIAGLWMVYRYSRLHGRESGPLSDGFNAAKCTRGKEIGICEGYATRDEALAAARDLERHVGDGACLYDATLRADALVHGDMRTQNALAEQAAAQRGYRRDPRCDHLRAMDPKG